MEHLREIFLRGKTRYFKKKEIILTPGKEMTEIFLIEKGFMIVYILDSKRKRKILYTLKSNDIFPLTPGIRNTKTFAYLEALTDATTVSISKKDFFTKVYSKKAYMKELVELLAEYMFTYEGRLSNLELKTAEKKIVGRILHFNSRFSVKKGKQTYIDIPLTHEFIAESINVARENVSRELSKLQKEGIIEYKKGYIAILNMNKLESKLEG